MPISLENTSNIRVTYNTGSNYIIETVKSDLYRRNEIVNNIVRDNIQSAPVTPNIYIENGTNNVYAVETYTYSGTANTKDFTRVFPKNTICDILIVGGGGGGGARFGGGGGSGLLIYKTNVTLNGNITIKVGNGGLGGQDSNGSPGSDGQPTTFITNSETLTAIGGGGGSWEQVFAKNGGSGGGGNWLKKTAGTGSGDNVTTFGNNGGLGYFTNNLGTRVNGGGGGAGGVGIGGGLVRPDGGRGKQIDITGTPIYYAGGGGGANSDYDGYGYDAKGLGGEAIGGGGGGGDGGESYPLTPAQNGTNGTGGGGGGGTFGYVGGNGGSGIVIIRYLLGSIPSNNLLTTGTEPTVNPSTWYTTKAFRHSESVETQTTHTINFPFNTQCDILIVGGGGSGSEAHGGGGGAGAVIFMKNVTMNGHYTIKVGKGGVCESTTSVNGKGGKGNDTEIFKTNNINNKIVAEGGGGGGQLANANGGSGGSGGGGDAYNVATGTGGAATAYTPVLHGVTGIKYGNNGGNAFGNPGHGGGGGGAGGVGENALAGYSSGNNENERAHGGVGIKSATINSVNYDFKTLFGTNVGGIVESDGFLYFGGGGGNGRWGATSGIGSEGGNGGLGGGGKGGWATSVTLVQPLGGTGYPGINGTGGGGGGGGDNKPIGGNGGSGIVIIKYLSYRMSEGNIYKTLEFSYSTIQQNIYTLNFPVRTVADINNNSNIILQGEYDISLSTTNSVITPKSNQYIPKPTTFTNITNISEERMYPPVRNFTTATTTVSGQTYGNGTYVVSFSSTLGTGLDPWTCFNTSTISGGHWNSDRYIAGVFNSTSFIVAGYLGDWLKIQLPVAIKLTRFNLVLRPTLQDRAPKDFKIYGSNDNITWVELVNKINAVYNASSIYEQTTPEITNTYTYYALVVNKIFSTGTVLNFDEWYIYGNEALSSSLSLRYHLLNPILDPIGAQWTYSSINPNVYHLGSVGIGTTSPEYSLDVRGFIYSSSGGYTSSALTKWSVLSDRRIKENIVKASYDKCLENVKNIELYNFNFKDNYVNTNDRHQLGFIAQEVQQVYPKAVEFSRMIMNLEEKIDDLLTLNTTQIDYTLYGAVKCLIQKIENIKIKMEQIKTVYNITI